MLHYTSQYKFDRVDCGMLDLGDFEENDDTDYSIADDLVFQVAEDRRYYVLVIYDIVNNKKRTRLAKMLLGYGFRVQKSAFEAELRRTKYKQLLKSLQRFADEEDSIRIYKFLDRGQVTVIGRADEYSIEDIIVI